MPGAVRPDAGAKAAASSGTHDPYSYDAAVDDFLEGLPIDLDTSAQDSTAAAAGFQDQKGVDEEVVVKKQRKVTPKLDENRLLSDQGIPKLRRIAKKNVKFRGKGHEFSDMARLMNLYQFWLDDLYPRAKFRDALAIVEKVGHSRRMQVARRAWIDESKVQLRVDEETQAQDVEMTSQQSEQHEPGLTISPTQDRAVENGADASLHIAQSDDIADNDELDMLLAEEERPVPQQGVKQIRKPALPFEEEDDDDDNHEGPDEDELDALLAEPSNQKLSSSRQQPEESHFADEEEIMADLGW